MSLHQIIKKRISDHGQAEQIQQLCLDGIKIGQFDHESIAEIQACKNLEYLTMNRCELKNLKGLPSLNKLLAFEAIGNKIKDDDLEIIGKNYPKLVGLSLDKNCIQKVESFSFLASLSQLQHVEIRGNPLAYQQDFRDKIFNQLPHLKIINSQDIFGDHEAILQNDTDSESSQQSSIEIFSQEDNIDQMEEDEDYAMFSNDDKQGRQKTQDSEKPRKYRQF